MKSLNRPLILPNVNEHSSGASVCRSVDPYTFCDIYRFAGDKVAELTAFMIRTDQAPAGARLNEAT